MAVYHILADAEPFSRTMGGASAQWIAGVVSAAGLQEDTVVVCPAADDSWSFPYVWVAPEMGRISLLPRPLQHPVLWRRRAKFYARMLRGFAARLERNDVIYVHNRPEMALAMVWSQQGRPYQNPVVLAMNDSQLANAPRPLVRHVAGRMARVIFPTEFVQHQAFEKWGLHMRATVLPFGAEEAEFFPDPDQSTLLAGELPLVVYAGPLRHQSGVHILMDAARLLTSRGVGVRVLVIERPDPGGAIEAVPSRSEYDEYIRRLRSLAGSNVWFESYTGIEHVADAMRAAAVVVCPSLHDEAFGLSNVEAMATGVPVAASCVGGIPEVFVDGGGLLVPPSDPIALANAIERLLGKTGVARLLRREGRASFLKNYSWPRIAESYVEMLMALPAGPAYRYQALP